ncbi:gluconokinase [Zhouia sp. PK063]|uniref:gluconokinase n=1 Tax=Zhouia sp. PK063 TaxID=3373602 RepID=UPI00379E65BD
MNTTPTIYFVIGVSGSGKTTIGKLLAKELQIPYFEADDYHSKANKEKMSKGIPLNDDDRKGWLQALHNEAKHQIAQQKSGVISCSALKQKYRDVLQKDIELQVKWIYLKGDYDVIYKRVSQRTNHYMPASLLKSQFETLEEPQDAITVNVNYSIHHTMDEIMEKLAGRKSTATK